MKRVVISLGVVAVAAAAIIVVLRGRALPVEMTQVVRRTVREYIIEDAKTRLADEYTVDMPVNGTLERIRLEVGDRVEEGQAVARVDPFGIEQEIKGLEALIDQARARTTGIETAKPKPEDLDAAAVRVREMKDAVAIAKRERAIAEIDYDEASKGYDRVRQLAGQGAVSQSQYDEAERRFKGLEQNRERARLAEQSAAKALEIAQLDEKRVNASVDDNEYLREVYGAEIESYQARINVLKDDLRKTEVPAPVTGVVLEKYIEDSRVLPAGTPLLKLGDPATIEIESDILSEEVGQVELGDPVEITGKALRSKQGPSQDAPSQHDADAANASQGDATDPVFHGTVKRIYPSGFKKISALGIEQQRVRALIDFDNTVLQLRPGTSVDVRIITDEHTDTLAVPERAVFRHQDGWAVFAVRDGRAKLTPVTVGLKNDTWAEILNGDLVILDDGPPSADGLQEGDTIIAELKNELKDGVRVAPPK